MIPAVMIEPEVELFYFRLRQEQANELINK